MSTANRIEELRQKFNENPRRYFAPLANEYRKAGDLEQAIALCREHLPKQPGHMSGYIVFGQALFEAKQLEEAQEVFEQALALDPENLIALRHLGDIALAKSRPSLARRWYERVLDADPRNDDIAAQLVSLAGMSTPRGGLPAIEEVAPPASSPTPAAPTIAQNPAPVVELPPARFTPRSFEPIDLDMPSVRSNPTPSYPPRAIEVPPIPTPDSALRAIDEFPMYAVPTPSHPIAATPSHPISEALDAFAAFDPAHALHDEDREEPLAWPNTPQSVAITPAPAAAESVPMSAAEALEFEEGLVAPEWPDTQDLVARMQTPMRAATPINVPATPDALEAFGREERDDLLANAPVEELLDLSTHDDATQAAAESTSDASLVTDLASDFAPTTNSPESVDAQSDFLADIPVTADASDHSSADDLAVANFADEFDKVSSSDVGIVWEITDDHTIANEAEHANEELEDAPSSFDAPMPRHEISMGLVSSFDEETAHPINESFAEHEQTESIEIVDAFEPASHDADESHDRPWLTNADQDASVSNNLGEPLFADYEQTANDETPAPAAAFTESDIDASSTSIAGAVAEVDAPQAVDDHASHAADEHVVQETQEDSLHAADERVPQAAYEHAPPSDEASFADVIDDDMQRLVDASTYGVHNEVAPDVIDVEAPGEVTSPLAFIDSIESMPSPVEYAPSATPFSGVPPIATPPSFTPISVPAIADASPASLPVSPTPPTPAIGSAAFVTETMAELLVSQGFMVRAVEVYEELVRRRPYDPVLTSRLAELRDVVAAQPGTTAVPTSRSATPIMSTTVNQTPATSAAIPTPAVAVPLYRQTPLSATPVYSTPISATPLSSVAIPGTPISVPALGYDAEVVERRTARDRFAELARRRVPRRTPPRASASIDEPVDGLASLFGTLPSDPAEDAAARALADAFSTVTEGGPSLFEADLASGDVRATPASSAAYATPPAPRPSRGAGAEFSFDRFFPDPASAAGSSSTPLPDTASPAHPEAQTGEDHAHFSAWLKGLTKP